MDYAYKILSDELRIIKKAIKEGDGDGYSEALKDRMSKVKDLDKALKLIDSTRPIITDRQVGNYKPN